MKSQDYRKYYFLFVITIIAVTVASQFIIRISLDKQTNDGNKISLAGYQTFLSSEVAKHSFRYVLAKEKNNSTKIISKEVEKSIQKLRDRHKALQFIDSYELRGENSPRVNELLTNSGKLLTDLNKEVKLLLDTNHLNAVSSIDKISLLSTSYSEKLKEVVYEYKTANSEKISYLKMLEMILALFMIGILLTEIFLIIKPALKKLGLKNKELKKSNDKLKELNQIKTEFLANMSHEIRTPLNGVIGMSHLLSRSELTQKQSESVKNIKSSAQNLLEIINEILDYSKLESGKTEIEKIEFSVHELIESVINLLSPTASAKDLTLDSFLDPEIPEIIRADQNKLRQVLINLIGNALKFTEQGEVKVKAEKKESESGFIQILFSIIDTGIGIAPEKLEKIFESFTQADNSTTRKYGGTGLGLAISKNLVEMLNGEIWVESELGVGTSFKFTAVVESRKSFELDKKIAAFENKKVLLISENKDNLKPFIKSLSNWGLNPTPFSNLKIFYDNAKHLESFDLCIIILEASEGLTTAEFIREKYTKEQLPIILSSSKIESSNSKNERDSIQFFIDKPIKQKRLLDLIYQSLKISNPKIENENTTLKKGFKNFSNLKVLVAEDNAINKAVATKSLELMGIQAEIANNGSEVLKKMKGELFDLILMDIQMPILDGFETTTKIRSSFSQNDQPIIIAMTAASDGSKKQTYLDRGMDDFLPKPLDLDELSDRISHWFTEKY